MFKIMNDIAAFPPWQEGPIDSKVERGFVSRTIRALQPNEDYTFPVGINEKSIRSTASQLSRDLKCKFVTHKYDDGTVGVWRKP
jgi:hypothetical protein